MSAALRAFDAFDWHALHAPDRTLVEGDDGVLTYGEAASRVRRLISGFHLLGIGHEDRIAVVAKNRAEILLLLIAALKGGPVIVPVNNRLSANEMGWIIEDAGCKAVIAETEFAQALGDRIPARVPMSARWSLDAPLPGWADFADWLEQQSERSVEPPARTDTAYLQVYTSGTTGRPKGVVLTEQNCLGQQLGLMACVDIGFQPAEQIYQALPLFHVGGIFVSLWAMYRGATLLLRRDFLAGATEQLLASGRVAHAALVPAMLKASVALPAGKGHDYSSLRSIIYGASPISAPTLRSAAARYGCGFVQIYGMTETHSVISMLHAEDHRRALADETSNLLASAGRPVAGVDLRIVDGAGASLPAGRSGEICVRAPQVMAGYWGCEDATREVLRDGYLWTGDAGYLDTEGYLHIVDRLKDIIVSGGENIAPREVEDVLLSHPDVADAAVIGVPDERWGESVKALIVCRKEMIDEGEIIAHCRRHLSGFKVPKSVGLVDLIPRNGAGKIQKNLLREPFWREQARRVS